MPLVPHTLTPPTGLRSLRERQQDEVRLAITNAGVALFLDLGFKATTIDTIAATAGVSRRTVFRHFSSKEEIVLAWSYISAEALATQVSSRPPEEPALPCLCTAIYEHVAARQTELPVAFKIGRLIEETPSLRAYSAEKYMLWETLLAAVLIERSRNDAALERSAPIAAMIAVGIFRLAASEWIAGDDATSLLGLLQDRLMALNILQTQ